MLRVFKILKLSSGPIFREYFIIYACFSFQKCLYRQKKIYKFLGEFFLALEGSDIEWRYRYRHPVSLPSQSEGESNRMTVSIPLSYFTPPRGTQLEWSKYSKMQWNTNIFCIVIKNTGFFIIFFVQIINSVWYHKQI